MTEQTLRAGDGSFGPASVLLRRSLWLDAVGSGGIGLLGLVATGWLSTWFDLPEGLLRGAALVMVPWVAVLVFMATWDAIPAAAVRGVIGFNLLWVAASIGLLLSGAVSPNGLGTAFVLVQAGAVLLFAVLQYAGTRRESET